MSLRYLLDTNIISNALRPRPHAGLAAWAVEHRAESATAAPVWHELWYGCQRLPVSAKRTTIEEYIRAAVTDVLPILPYDERAALWHANERSRLVAIGQTPAYFDGQIAAIAATNDLTLVTFNTSDFRGFADLKLLDWSA